LKPPTPELLDVVIVEDNRRFVAVLAIPSIFRLFAIMCFANGKHSQSSDRWL
jgi:hypothetical protein